MKYFIGVDGGGTHCRAAVVDETGVILGNATTGSANIASDFAMARGNIMDAMQLAWKKANLPQSLLNSAYCALGLAGANVQDFAQRLKQSLPFQHCEVTDDRATTVRGVLKGGDGCIAAIGTGTFYFGRSDTREKSIGGWGFLIGDDGGGARLGQALLRRVIHCHDGFYPPSELTRQILSRFNQSPGEMVEFAQHADLRQLASLAPDVVAAAREKDTHGSMLISELVATIQQCIDQVDFVPGCRLFMIGGLGPILIEFMQQKYIDASTTSRGSSLSGALDMARDLPTLRGEK